MNKLELLSVLDQNRAAMLKALDGLSDEAMQEPGVVGEWSVKDLLTHLTAWEAELITVLAEAKQGTKPKYADVTSTRIDELNAQWRKQHKDRPLDRVLADFHAVRRQTIRQVESVADDDLNNPKRYAWLGGRPLSKWIEADSFGHEAEHTAQILEWRKRRGY